MSNTRSRIAARSAGMLDEDALMAVLSRHFPSAKRAAVREAAEDVLLLELLARDVGVVWEDAMAEPVDRTETISVFDGGRRRES